MGEEPYPAMRRNKAYVREEKIASDLVGCVSGRSQGDASQAL